MEAVVWKGKGAQRHRVVEQASKHLVVSLFTRYDSPIHIWRVREGGFHFHCSLCTSPGHESVLMSMRLFRSFLFLYFCKTFDAISWAVFEFSRGNVPVFCV